MGLAKILVLAVFTYVFMLILLRLSGKRTVAQSTSFALVLAIVVGDLFDDLFGGEVPASQFVVAAGTLVLLQLTVSLGSYASETFARLVESSPEMIVRNGTPVQAGLRHEQLEERLLWRLIVPGDA